MGGDVLASWIESPVPGPADRPPPPAGRFRGPRPQARIAISGVDGAGKSTLIANLQNALDRCGMPTEVIWTRPGMGLKRLDTIAKLIRRSRGGHGPGIQQLAEGGDPTQIASRRGVVGWLWLTLVTMAFVWTVWRETGQAKGVVIYDRHLLDALGTIDVFYRGVDSRLHRRAVRALMPPADLTVWLVVDPEAAVSRKPGDMIGRDLVTAQHESYLRQSGSVPGLIEVDATRPPEDILLEVLTAFDRMLSERRPRLTTRVITALRRAQSAIRER
jgi:thymidylate kinase